MSKSTTIETAPTMPEHVRLILAGFREEKGGTQ
jgi:hypothetical protein